MIQYLPVIIAGGIALLLALAWWLTLSALRTQRRQVQHLHDEVQEVAAASSFGRRIAKLADPDLQQLGDNINQLFETLHDKRYSGKTARGTVQGSGQRHAGSGSGA